MFCPHCGKKAIDGYPNCKHCSAALPFQPARILAPVPVIAESEMSVTALWAASWALLRSRYVDYLRYATVGYFIRLGFSLILGALVAIVIGPIFIEHVKSNPKLDFTFFGQLLAKPILGLTLAQTLLYFALFTGAYSIFGETPKWGRQWRYALARSRELLWPALLVLILGCLAAYGGLALFGIGILLTWTRTGLAFNVFLDGSVKGFKTIIRSNELLRGRTRVVLLGATVPGIFFAALPFLLAYAQEQVGYFDLRVSPWLRLAFTVYDAMLFLFVVPMAICMSWVLYESYKNAPVIPDRHPKVTRVLLWLAVVAGILVAVVGGMWQQRHFTDLIGTIGKQVQALQDSAKSN